MKIKLSELEDLIVNKFTSTYYTPEQAKEIAEVLIYAEITGKNTQGIVKLLGTEPIQSIKPKSEVKVIKDTKLSALIDGGGNPGILVCKIMTQLAIEKCKEHGFTIIGNNNTFSSTGSIGYYANEIAKNDFIGLIMAGSPGGVAPHGSISPLLGTNPIAFGFPTQSSPIIFDMATAAITWYGLVRAKTLGQKIPEGVAIDNAGELTTDPAEAMSGAILPFDKDYKGSGLSMMIEILTGPFVGAAYCDPEGSGDWGNLIIAIDPDLMIGREEFKKHNSLLVKKIKHSQKAKNVGEIFLPGERSLKNKNHIEGTGEIEIDDKILDQLKQS